jgi:hypothetical protein
MDWPGLFERRSLWDLVTIALLSGLAAISVTTMLPAFRRLKRHAVRGGKLAFPPKKAITARSGWVVSNRDGVGGDFHQNRSSEERTRRAVQRG